jgi:hypothetical protein
MMAGENDGARPSPQAPLPSPQALLLADRREGPDLWGAGEAMRPLAELCLSAEAETPFALALVGDAGAGKSFALRRLVEEIEARARAPRTRVVVARLDAASAGADPASAVAAAVFSALEPDYAALADEAAHATVDPRHAAAAASERRDEIVARLENERRARDETEARRARLTQSLLHETPGSRVDAFIRASRASIGARLKRFGFGDGDPEANFRALVGDLAASRRSSRFALFLRAIWAYRGQTRLVWSAIFAFILAFLADRLRLPEFREWLIMPGRALSPALDWMQANDATLGLASEALAIIGVLALGLNLWRAASFTGLLFRGLRLLHIDVAERRRELDASAARLERRVAALQIEAEAAEARAETFARKVGSGAPAARAPGPAFLAPADAPQRAARAFLDELGRAMAAAVTPAPQRIVVALDGLEALAPAEARRFLETAVRTAGHGMALVAAVDLARLAADPREIAESLFEAVYDVGAPAQDFARLLAPAAPVEAKQTTLAAPLDETEIGFLRTASVLLSPRPRAAKRFYNAYRLARAGEAPRGALALSLAALMGRDPDAAAALRSGLEGEGETLATLAYPPGLRAAFAALGLEGADKAAARAAFAAAQRFAPWA